MELRKLGPLYNYYLFGLPRIFVAIPENLADLERIAAKFPGGTWEEIPRLFKVEVL